jgi:phosphoglucomutase
MEGLDGSARLRRVMQNLRENPLASFGGVPIAFSTDHKAGVTVNMTDGSRMPTGLGNADALYFTLQNGDKIVVRPSGTEPKIKFYFLCRGEDVAIIERKIKEYQIEAEALTVV